MTPGVAPSDPSSSGGTYDKFWKALQAHKPELKNMFPDGPILVEWGHQLSPTENPVREDHRITEAERFVNEQVSYQNLKKHPGPNNVVVGDWGIPSVRQIVTSVREGVVSFGLTDVVYYCSEDGEIYVRAHVYNQVLVKMQPYVAVPNVRIHLFGHSLGVTVIHDFLFGLFKKAMPLISSRNIREGCGQVRNFKSGATRRKTVSLLWVGSHVRPRSFRS
jgi:hypothetical protein